MCIHVFSSYTFFQFHHAMTQHWQLELHQLELQQIRQEHLGHHCPGNPRAGAPDFWAKFTKWMFGKKHGKTTCPHPAKKVKESTPLCTESKQEKSSLQTLVFDHIFPGTVANCEPGLKDCCSMWLDISFCSNWDVQHNL